jgi:hypothetical protein
MAFLAKYSKAAQEDQQKAKVRLFLLNLFVLFDF